MSNKEQSAIAARSLMMSEYQGILSTHSVEARGYPFGSVTPYCFDRKGRPVILISHIAQHTKNIKADPKVSLIVMERDMDDVQANGRVTYLGEAMPIPSDDADTMQRYYRYFPDARDYHKTHDFDFYYLEFYRVRFIGGFGKIYWLERDAFLKQNPFSADEETRAIDHMNKDHADAIRRYCNLGNIPLTDDDHPVMVGIDGEGFNLLLAKRIYRFGFAEPVTTLSELRSELARLAKLPASIRPE